jgi:hypothetical protein
MIDPGDIAKSMPFDHEVYLRARICDIPPELSRPGWPAGRALLASDKAAIQWALAVIDELRVDERCLLWLNRNYGIEKKFWYGQRTLKDAVLLAIAEDKERECPTEAK